MKKTCLLSRYYGLEACPTKNHRLSHWILH